MNGMAALLLAGTTLLSPNAPAAPAVTCAAGQVLFTFDNQCSYTIWVGEFGPTAVLPPGGELGAGDAIRVCISPPWSAGRFWPRTGCTGTGTTLNCVTGQCGAAGQGEADCTQARMSGNPPTTLFEVTLGENDGSASANFDASLASGYNVPMWVQVDGTGCDSETAGCANDLLATCPAALQMTVPPSASGDPSLPCGTDTYCPSGTCLTAGSTCLVGCWDPGDACTQASPPASLACDTAIPGATGTDCAGNPVDPVTYADMYLAKNYSDGGDGVAMASGNQGNATCFDSGDCLPTAPDCVTSGFPAGYDSPVGAGVCLDLAAAGSSNSYGDGARTCSGSTVGAACGGYLAQGFSDALGYTCQPVTYTQSGGGGTQTAYVCLPPLTTGLGSCSCPTGTKDCADDPVQLYSATARVMNQSWMTAALQAGGGTTPYYETFQTACGSAYLWQYDDAADHSCTTVSSFAVTFCPAGAAPATPPRATALPPPPLSVRKQMATLSFLAYLGGEMKGDDEAVERKLAECLEQTLAADPRVAGWGLAWGPAVSKFPVVAELDDNMMYVVRSAADPAHLAIVVRGTNPPAVLDWLVEDFDVADQVTWESGPQPTEAKISKSISEGLHLLQTMTAASGQTLVEFLKQESGRHPSLQIDVTGHSLGGALSPTLALWLADTERQWNQRWSPTRGARFAVYPLAGPTAGNAAFAAYYDSRLGAVTDRMYGHYDVIPRAWEVETLATVPGIYEPFTGPDAAERGLLDGLRDLVRDKGYTQISRSTDAMPGAVNTSKDYEKFVDQLFWQHHCSYQCALGIEVQVPSTEQCPTPSFPTCTLPCP